MNRTVILLILFLALGFGSYLLLQKEEPNGTFDHSYDTDFTVDNKDDVYKIFIADRKGNQNTLLRKGDHWENPEGQRIRKYPIDFILRVLTEVEHKYLLSAPEAKNIVQSFASNSIKVEVYDKSDANMLTFYIGPNSRDHEGSYMIKEGSNNPQIMNIPGFVGELRTMFELKGDDWRDRSIVRYDSDNIESIEVVYPKQKNKSFRLEQKNGATQITPLDQFTKVLPGKPNESVIGAYLTEFEHKIAEDFSNDMHNPDSVMARVPFAHFKINTKDGQEQKIKFIVVVTDQVDENGKPRGANDALVRYYAQVNEKDIFVTQHQALSGIFRSYDSFYR